MRCGPTTQLKVKAYSRYIVLDGVFIKARTAQAN